MNLRLIDWWRRDSARNSYIFCQFVIGLPFSLFGTYITYQLQVVGYLIGTDSEGSPCSTYCLVPFGGSRLDLNSVLLYLNALGFGLGGALMVLFSVYADFWKNKSFLVTLFMILYGVLSIPSYWLRSLTTTSFKAMEALYVVYAVLTYLLIAVLNIYIPHCMRQADERRTVQDLSRDDSTGSKSFSGADHKSRKYGFSMSIFGTVANFIAGAAMLAIVIILSSLLRGDAAQTAGLLVTTIIGFVTVVGSAVAFFGLPVLPSIPSSLLVSDWKQPFLEFVRPFRDLIVRKNMLLLLISYTVYTDTNFAMYSVTAQLFFTTVKPSTLEYSLYSLAPNIFSLVCTLTFYLIQSSRPHALEKWLVFGYALILIVPVWGCIGLADVNFGFKNRWEFYVQLLIATMSGSIVNPTFRVLFSELIPKGSEIRWFGLQLVLSCATCWVSYITNAPLQNATHQLRFPLILCLVIFILPVVLEVVRITTNAMKQDKMRWGEHDASPSQCSVESETIWVSDSKL